MDGVYGIKVGAPVSPVSVVFQNSGYTLTNDTVQTVTPTGNPFLTVAAGKTNTIGANVTVTVGFTSGLGAVGGGGSGF